VSSLAVTWGVKFGSDRVCQVFGSDRGVNLGLSNLKYPLLQRKDQITKCFKISHT